MKKTYEKMKKLMVAILCTLIVACSPMQLISGVLKPKPSIELGIDTDLSEGKQETVETQVGTDTAIRGDVETVQTNNNGLDVADLSAILIVVGLLLGTFIYGAFQIGLRTPRPIKFTSAGRK